MYIISCRLTPRFSRANKISARRLALGTPGNKQGCFHGSHALRTSCVNVSFACSLFKDDASAMTHFLFYMWAVSGEKCNQSC